jgi:titin
MPAGGSWHGITVTPRSSYTITGLRNGATYWFRVAAHNVVGQSPWSTNVKATPLTVPSVPRSLRATAGNARVTLSWLVPASSSGSPITAYRVSYMPAGGSWRGITVTPRTSHTITGLRNGTTYYFRIAAYNAVGVSPWTPNVSARTFDVPARVTNLVANPGNQRATLVWTPPAARGAPITRYTIQLGVNGVWKTIGYKTPTSATANQSFLVPDLTNGTRYSFRIAATNIVGTSAWSNTASVVPAPPPPPVTFGPGGTYRVGVDIPAGLYRASGSSDPTTWCYWERLSGFSGSFDDIIDNDFIDGPIPPFYLQIQPSDVGFFTRPGCGVYTKIG